MDNYSYDSSGKRILYRGEKLSKADVLLHLNTMLEALDSFSVAFALIVDAGSVMAPYFMGSIVDGESVDDAVEDIAVGGTD